MSSLDADQFFNATEMLRTQQEKLGLDGTPSLLTESEKNDN